MVAPVPDEELQADIRRVYAELGEPPSESQYDEHGEYSSSAVRRAFGKFTAGREAAGIPNPDMRGGQNRIGREDLLSELHRLADELDRVPRRTDMESEGAYAEGPYRREFGSWSEALITAGYEPARPGSHVAEYVDVECANCGASEQRLRSQISDQRAVFCSQECHYEYRQEQRSGENHPLFDRVEVECTTCGETLLRKPSVVEKKERFFCDRDCYGTWCSEERTGGTHPRWKGGGELYYGPNWQRQRRKCLERDGYTCQRCGRTEEESQSAFGRGLTVHHEIPVREWHQGANDEPDWEKVNALKNLTALCLPCHRTVESSLTE
jgi:5-methylcytosine-specific restriction endonuclease McrA